MKKIEEYEALSYKVKFYRAVRAGVITLLAALLILTPTLRFWQVSVARRQTLREAKNVVLNMNLLAADFYATGEPVRDAGRDSGLTEAAEQKVRSYSAADGEIHIVAWNAKEGHVTAMSYQQGRFLITYRYDVSTGEETWTTFWQVHIFPKQQDL